MKHNYRHLNSVVFLGKSFHCCFNMPNGKRFKHFARFLRNIRFPFDWNFDGVSTQNGLPKYSAFKYEYYMMTREKKKMSNSEPLLFRCGRPCD